MNGYYLGGRDNYDADRELATTAEQICPGIVITARANRDFMRRSTERLAQLGMQQWLDIGMGIPRTPNLHEVAQTTTPQARIVYVDNDRIVFAHGGALMNPLTPAGQVRVIHADLREPAVLLAKPDLRQTLDLSKPVAVSLHAVLHYIEDEPAQAALHHLKDVLAPGSTLSLSHLTSDLCPHTAILANAYMKAGILLRPRTRRHIEQFLDGWDLLDPGIVPIDRWRISPAPPPEHPQWTSRQPHRVLGYAAVARKPDRNHRHHPESTRPQKPATDTPPTTAAA